MKCMNFFAKKLLARISEFTRKFGVPKGCERILLWLIPPDKLRDPEFFFELAPGLWMFANWRSHMERRVLLHGEYGVRNEKNLTNLIKKGDWVIDCGASIGTYTLRFAQKVGKMGKVLAIEPHDCVRMRLQSNVRANRLQDRIEILDCAVSDTPGEASFFFPPPSAENQGNSSLFGKSDDCLEKKVEVSTLDRIVRDKQFKRVDLLRCEVQGNELKALQGAEEIISRWHPKISLRFEQGVALKSGLRLDGIVEFLDRFSYKGFFLSGNSFVEMFSEIHHMTDQEILFV